MSFQVKSEADVFVESGIQERIFPKDFLDDDTSKFLFSVSLIHSSTSSL